MENEEFNVSDEARDRVRGKLADALKKDFTGDVDGRRINNVKKSDGMISARFNIDVKYKREKGEIGTDYRDWDKSFDSWEEFTEYAETFFEQDAKFFESIVKQGKSGTGEVVEKSSAVY